MTEMFVNFVTNPFCNKLNIKTISANHEKMENAYVKLVLGNALVRTI